MFRTRIATLLVTAAVVVSACTSAEDRAANYLERARVAMEAEDFIKAELDLKNTLQINPDNVDALFMMAKIAERDQAWPRMYNTLNRVIELDPDNLDARIRLARLYTLGQQFDTAVEQINAVLERDPGNHDARVLNATMIHRDGQAEVALAEVEKVLEEDPSNVGAITYLATYHFAEDKEKALAIVEDGLERNPNEATFRVLQFRLLEELERSDEIETVYKELIAAQPDKPQLSYSYAGFLLKSNRVDDAEKVLEDLIANRPDDVTSKVEYARFVAGQRDPEAAHAVLDRYIADEPDTYQFRFLKAGLYEATGALEEAEAVYRQIIDRDRLGPEGLRARNLVAQIKLRGEDREAAEVLIAEVLEAEPSNARALLMRSALQFQDDDLAASITNLRTILRNNPTAENDPTAQRALLLLGKAHLKEGDPGLARDSFRKLVAVAPENLDAVTSLAQILMREQNYAQAREVLETGLAKNPDELRLIRMLIDALSRLEDWDAAGSLADRILDDPQGAALGHYIKGRLALVKRDFDTAIAEFTRSVEAKPEAVEALSGLLTAYVQNEDLDGAEAYMKGYLAEHPDNIHGLTVMGELYGRKGDWDKAVEYNDKALASNPQWVPAYRNLVGVHFENGDWDAAVAATDRGLEHMPDNIDLRLLKASAFERAEKFEEAIEIYTDVLERRPDINLAANNFAALVADHQPTEERLQLALSYASRFRDDSNPVFQDTLGWLYYRLGDYAQAVPLLERAVAGAGHIPQLRYHLGMAYYKLDRLENARRELQAALDKPADFHGRSEAESTLDLL